MKEQDLEIIKSRQLFLKNGIKSSELLLSDPEDGDSYLTFLIRYVNKNETGNTNFEVIDEHHAHFAIDVRPNSITRPSEPIKIGTYGKNNRPLYINFIVQPQIAQTGEHEVNITFFLRKEDSDGSNK